MIASPHVLYEIEQNMEIPEALTKKQPSRSRLLPTNWGEEKYCTVVMYDPVAKNGHLHWVFSASKDRRAKTLMEYAGPHPPPALPGRDGLPPAHRYIFNVYPGMLQSPSERSPFDISFFDRQAQKVGSTEYRVRPKKLPR